ncbi:hypothetical protein SLA2020_293360 [Shorea laevis]
MCSPILEMPRVFLTPVASTKFKVHGGPSIGVIRVCYNIALHSKSPINQAMLEAMPTQMISIIFGRMETDPFSSSVPSDHTATASAEKSRLAAEKMGKK